MNVNYSNLYILSLKLSVGYCYLKDPISKQSPLYYYYMIITSLQCKVVYNNECKLFKFLYSLLNIISWLFVI